MIVVSFEKFIVVAKNVVRIFSFTDRSVQHEGNSWKCIERVDSPQYSCVWVEFFFLYQTVCKILHQELFSLLQQKEHLINLL